MKSTDDEPMPVATVDLCFGGVVTFRGDALPAKTPRSVVLKLLLHRLVERREAGPTDRDARLREGCR